MPATNRSPIGLGRFFSPEPFLQEFVGGGKFTRAHARAFGNLALSSVHTDGAADGTPTGMSTL